MADSPSGVGACGASITSLACSCSACLPRWRDRQESWTPGRLASWVGEGYQPLVSTATVRSHPADRWPGAPGTPLRWALQVLVPAYVSTGVTVSYGDDNHIRAGRDRLQRHRRIFARAAPCVRKAIDRLASRLRSGAGSIGSTLATPASADDDHGRSPDWPRSAEPRYGLSVTELSVRYGGVLAADTCARRRAGKITGLIGPNGLGKQRVQRLLRPGPPNLRTVLLDQRSLDASVRRPGPAGGWAAPSSRWNCSTSLTARENVALAARAASGLESARPPHQSRQPAKRGRAQDRSGDRAVTPITTSRPAGRALSTGQRRLVELRGVSPGRFHVLLLDEPSSGLDRSRQSGSVRSLTRVARASGRHTADRTRKALVIGSVTTSM